MLVCTTAFLQQVLFTDQKNINRKERINQAYNFLADCNLELMSWCLKPLSPCSADSGRFCGLYQECFICLPIWLGSLQCGPPVMSPLVCSSFIWAQMFSNTLPPSGLRLLTQLQIFLIPSCFASLSLFTYIFFIAHDSPHKTSEWPTDESIPLANLLFGSLER